MMKRKFFGRRRFGKPPARKRLVWCTSKVTFTETFGTVSAVLVLVPGQWVDNATSGTKESAKILQLVLIPEAGRLATGESRTFMVAHDDVNQVGLNPETVASYSDTDCVHLGKIVAAANVAAQGADPVPNGYPDNVRRIRINRRTDSTKALFVWISPAAAAGNQLTFTILARVLVQIG